MFQQIFIDTASKYTKDTDYVSLLYTDIVSHYSNTSRHYHTLQHLVHLLVELLQVKDNIQNWDLVVFAIAYHDIIYNVVNHNNEEKCAAYAVKALSPLLSKESLDECRVMIMATKSHLLSANQDINYFTDADLSILGADESKYLEYTRQIRKEYKYYPDFVYTPGRQKVLKHFLNMQRIYKTDYFYHRYEAQARINLKGELNNTKPSN